MTHHAYVLTSPPGAAAVDPVRVEALAAKLNAACTWLSPREACWIEPAQPAPDAAPQLRAELAGQSIDINAVDAPRDQARKLLLVADMESTVIEQECLDELANYCGLRATISTITERAMRGELDFESALRERVGLLKGLAADVLQEIYDQRVTMMPGAATLIATMQANGATCALVSGGFSFYTERVASRLGFDTQQANTLLIADGHLTGDVAEPILGREAKLAALQRLAAERTLPLQSAMAVGDGANDLAMLRDAGLGVAFRAKPIVAEQARASIVYGDLTALLYLQGYARDEFIL